MLEALTSEESAAYGTFLSSVQLFVHRPEENIGAYAQALSLQTLADHFPGEAASAASSLCQRVFTTSMSKSPFPLVYAGQAVPENSILFVAESNQEIMDSVVLAYRISEDPRVLAPSAVLFEYPDFIETVRLPNLVAMKSFLPRPKWNNASNKYNLESAMPVITKAEEAWKKKFHRPFGLVEGYRIEDAKHILVMSGFHFPTCRLAVDRLRSSGIKAGALRIRTVRPFPSASVTALLANAEKISVLDTSLWGPLVASKMPAVKSKFIYSKYLSVNDFLNIFANIGKEGSFQIK